MADAADLRWLAAAAAGCGRGLCPAQSGCRGD
jgi:hypothetical protein